MKKKTIAITAVAAALVLGTAGVAVAVTEPWDGDDNLTGESLERASEAALAEVDGTVIEAEKSDNLGQTYVVEVRSATGADTDVALDENYEIVWVKADDDDNDRDDDRDGASATAPDASSGETPAATQPGSVDDADDVPLSETERASAQAAALAEIGSGTVTDVDRSDDATHAFEVEVTREDGTDVDVLLNAEFGVVGLDEDN